jgi:hypothetical protein
MVSHHLFIVSGSILYEKGFFIKFLKFVPARAAWRYKRHLDKKTPRWMLCLDHVCFPRAQCSERCCTCVHFSSDIPHLVL